MRTRPRLDAATVKSLLEATVAAPSIRDTQPRRFRLEPAQQVLEVYSAPERTLPSTDPMHRAPACPWARPSSTSGSRSSPRAVGRG